MMRRPERKKKVAWGITGGGDKLAETIHVMSDVATCYRRLVDIDVYLSKAGDQVLRHYQLTDALRSNFEKISVEEKKVRIRKQKEEFAGMDRKKIQVSKRASLCRRF